MNNIFNGSLLVSEYGLKELWRVLRLLNKASISIYKIAVLELEGIFEEAH